MTNTCVSSSLVRFGLCGLLLVLSSGCGTIPKNLGCFPEDQMIVVNGKGRLLEPVGNLGPETYSSIVEMKEHIPLRMEDKYVADVAKRTVEILNQGSNVTVYIHGGLNTQVGTMKKAARLLSLPKEYNTPHFVFVNWQSSLLSSYRDRLFAIREGKDIRNREWWRSLIAKLTSLLYLPSDLATGVARVPVTFERQLATLGSNISIGPGLDIREAKIEFGPGRLQNLTNVTQVVKPSEMTPNAGGVQVADSAVDLGNTLHRVLALPFRIITTPLTDALGTPAWDVMQRRCTILFNRETRISTGGEPSCFASPTVVLGPLQKFGNALAKESTNVTNKVGELNLVVHSMGAILAAQLLRHCPEIHFDNIVFMAAACSVREMTDSVFPYMAHPGNESSKFYNLMLHPQAETRESYLLGLAPEGSLLVMLDQFFERPDSIFDRMAGRYTNVGLNGRYIDSEIQRIEELNDALIGPRVVMKVFPYEDGGRPHVPMTHGSFGDFQFWEHAFWEQNGRTNYRSLPKK
jgi:hypothetical protein